MHAAVKQQLMARLPRVTGAGLNVALCVDMKGVLSDRFHSMERRTSAKQVDVGKAQQADNLVARLSPGPVGSEGEPYEFSIVVGNSVLNEDRTVSVATDIPAADAPDTPGRHSHFHLPFRLRPGFREFRIRSPAWTRRAAKGLLCIDREWVRQYNATHRGKLSVIPASSA